MNRGEERGERTLAVVGGGLAGLAAAVAAVERGFRVELFEQFHSLGGRAGSFVDSQTAERVDFCQHVAMGCCTGFLDFCRRTGIDDCFTRSRRLRFIAPDGRHDDFTPSRWLPAPLHLLPGLMRLKFLTLGERWKIIRALKALSKMPMPGPLSLRERVGVRAVDADDHLSPSPPAPLPTTLQLVPGEGSFSTIGDWLRDQNQSQRAIDRFWSVVLVSALGETVDRASFEAARKVFVDGFLASRDAGDLVLPTKPLGEIFGDRLAAWLAEHGVAVHCGAAIRRIEGENRRVTAVTLADGARREFDYVVSAVPWRNVKSLFDENLLAAMPAIRDVERIEPAAITAVHLWFDRPVVSLPHAVLVERLGQWLFAEGPHLQVVISASHRLPKRDRGQWVAAIRGELEAIWPAIGQARLLHDRVITQPMAVFSMQPGVDRWRPDQQTAIENLALAGDWTATGWPGTMESAIRSGRRAVDVFRNG